MATASQSKKTTKKVIRNNKRRTITRKLSSKAKKR